MKDPLVEFIRELQPLAGRGTKLHRELANQLLYLKKLERNSSRIQKLEARLYAERRVDEFISAQKKLTPPETPKELPPPEAANG